MTADRGVEVLSEVDAARLLRGGEVGRVGVTIGALPAIFPVNYRVVDGAVVFRTTVDSSLLLAADGAVVAFEVDDYELSDRTGWSVLAVGTAQRVVDPTIVASADAAGLTPFVDGQREVVVRIVPTLLSGRRLQHAPGTIASPPAPRVG